jgi:hypothetical protein
MNMQGSEMAPTAAELYARAKQESAYASLMANWSAFKGSK